MATKKNESKPKKSAKVAADTAANEQNTTAAVENTAAENQEPATESNDSLTQDVKNAAAAVPVTVVVLLTSPGNDALMLRHCLRSLAKNLRGVDATVLVVGKVKPSGLDAESFIECSDTTSRRVALAVEQAETERIVLMTERMHLIRPVLLSEIAVLKADEKPTFVDKTAIAQQSHSDTISSTSLLISLRTERRKRGMAKMPTTSHSTRKNTICAMEPSIWPPSGLLPLATALSSTIITIAKMSSRISTLITRPANCCCRSPRSSNAL